MTQPLARNLNALEGRNPPLAARIAGASRHPGLHLRTSRTGIAVPCVTSGTRTSSLHSLVDPVREAERLVTALTNGNEAPHFCLFEGLGAAFQIHALLRSGRISRGVVVEANLSLLRALLEEIDLSELLARPEIDLMVDASPDALSAYIQSTYLPTVMGAFLSVPLRARISLDRSRFEALHGAAVEGLRAVGNDHAVQSSFGRTWARNIVTNLVQLSPHPLPRIDHAIVIGAGPSLEGQLHHLGQLRSDAYLIATDTALPALSARGIDPDAVLVIDCQAIGYRHFLDGIPSTTTLFAELGAPPPVLRRAARVVPVAGGHPLSRLAARRLGLLTIDTSGGNVGHAAVSLGFALGARTLSLFGTDFSYPRGAAYVRGTYLHQLFRSEELRTRPIEASFARMLFDGAPLLRESVAGRIRYTTELLVSYRDRFERSYARSREQITVIPGQGLPIDLTHAAIQDSDPPSRPAAAGSPTPGAIRAFIADYREAIRALPSSHFPGGATMAAPSPAEGELLATLYPLMTWLNHHETNSLTIDALYADARGIVLSLFDRG